MLRNRPSCFAGHLLELLGLGADRTNGIEICKVRVDHMHHINVFEHADPVAFGFTEDVGRECVIADNDEFINALTAVNNSVRLKTVGVQPTHVQNEDRLQLFRCQTSLGGCWNPVRNELGSLYKHVNGTRRNGIKPSRLASDCDCSDRENRDHRSNYEYDFS